MQRTYVSMINELSLEEKAILLVDNGLYVNGWSLYDEAQDIILGVYSDSECFIHFAGENELQGVVVVTNGTVNIFVKPEHRRKKVGTYLMERAEKFIPKKDMIYGYGVDGCDKFWTSIFNMVN